MSSIRVADRYALDREIGRGGSGAVWLARDEVLGRLVALKRIGLPPGASEFDLERAEREARLAARVSHPNVISVFDFVRDGDQQWLVTEYVDGTTLAQMIHERGGLRPDEAAPILLQTAEALAAAHEKGVVHRDVKPSNILIARDGTVRLSDFGIARGVADASLTQTGLVTGSPAYLAPEVATGSSAQPASDVWSFGTTVFHTLAGHPPYEVEGASVLAVLYRIAHEPPPRLPDAGWLSPLLEATLDRDPARRPPMREVVTFLRAGPPASTSVGAPVLPQTRTEVLPETPTQALPALPTAATAPLAPPPPAAPTGPPSRVGAAAARPRRRGLQPVLLGAAALLVVALVGVALLLSGGEDRHADTAAPKQTPTSSGADAGDGGGQSTPTAAALETFARTYVDTAARDPHEGFAMLTPAYQSRSPEYAKFWGAVTNPTILDVSANPADLTVTYTYRYQLKHEGTREETVTLHLVQDGDRLLIASAVSSG